MSVLQSLTTYLLLAALAALPASALAATPAEAFAAELNQTLGTGKRVGNARSLIDFEAMKARARAAKEACAEPPPDWSATENGVERILWYMTSENGDRAVARGPDRVVTRRIGRPMSGEPFLELGELVVKGGKVVDARYAHSPLMASEEFLLKMQDWCAPTPEAAAARGKVATVVVPPEFSPLQNSEQREAAAAEKSRIATSEKRIEAAYPFSRLRRARGGDLEKALTGNDESAFSARVAQLAKNPKDASTWVAPLAGYWRFGHHEKALASLDWVEKNLTGPDPALDFLRSYTFERKGDTARALTLARKAGLGFRPALFASMARAGDDASVRAMLEALRSIESGRAAEIARGTLDGLPVRLHPAYRSWRDGMPKTAIEALAESIRVSLAKPDPSVLDGAVPVEAIVRGRTHVWSDNGHDAWTTRILASYSKSATIEPRCPAAAALASQMTAQTRPGTQAAALVTGGNSARVWVTNQQTSQSLTHGTILIRVTRPDQPHLVELNVRQDGSGPVEVYDYKDAASGTTLAESARRMSLLHCPGSESRLADDEVAQIRVHREALHAAQTGDVATAIKLLTASDPLDTDPALARTLAEMALAQKDVSALQRALATLERREPDALSTPMTAFRSWAALGDGDRALVALSRAEALFGPDAYFDFLRASVLFQVGKTAEAHERAESAVKKEPADQTFALQAFNKRVGAGDFAGAVRILEYLPADLQSRFASALGGNADFKAFAESPEFTKWKAKR